jgi:hypothetical protein
MPNVVHGIQTQFKPRIQVGSVRLKKHLKKSGENAFR